MNKNPYFDPDSKWPKAWMSGLKTPLFMKYFPKYLKKFNLISKNGSVKSKVKRMKVIRYFTAPDLKTSPEWRLLLSNKMKFFKILSRHTQSPTQFIEKIKLFTQLKSIQIDFFESFVPRSLVNDRIKVFNPLRTEYINIAQ